ncbi:hypothetical protein BGZ94_005878 [Podila epigama]|nr:hypothetical protein BGZ94_005878 [Podila epigama]
MARRNFGKNMSSVITRNFVRRMSAWLYKLIVKKAFHARNQASFLPLVPDTGSSKPRYQRSLHMTLKILKEQEGLTGVEIIARKDPDAAKAAENASTSTVAAV